MVGVGYGELLLSSLPSKFFPRDESRQLRRCGEEDMRFGGRPSDCAKLSAFLILDMAYMSWIDLVAPITAQMMEITAAVIVKGSIMNCRPRSVSKRLSVRTCLLGKIGLQIRACGRI